MQRFMRFLIGLIGAAVVVGLAFFIESFGIFDELGNSWRLTLVIGVGIIGFVLAYTLAPKWMATIKRGVDTAAARMESVPLTDVIFGTVGLFIALIIANLVTTPFVQLSVSYLGNFLGVAISVIIYIVLGLLGIRIAIKSKDEVMTGLQGFREDLGNKNDRVSVRKKQARLEKKRAHKNTMDHVHGDEEFMEVPKILDTSVIIDGRIFEVMKVGFLDGPYIISHYVLEELQHISDSADGLRRERGRKGLDSINDLQKHRSEDVIVDNELIDEVKEVDAKLLILTNHYQGKIVTNDYNLNKVATVQNIPVLNVNDLANALKPIVIPGETMEVKIIKQGKEPEQGLGYLDDGTMIVVENGYEYIGQTVLSTVTSVLQTSAGKMIFTRIQK